MEDQVVNQEVVENVEETPQAVNWEEEAKKHQSLSDKRLADYQKLESDYKQTKGQIDQWNEMLKDEKLYNQIQGHLSGGQSQPEQQSSPTLDPYSDDFGSQLGALIKNEVGQVVQPIQEQFKQAEENRQRAAQEAQMKAELKGLGIEGNRQQQFFEFLNKPQNDFKISDLVKVFNTLNPTQSDIEEVRQTQSSPVSAGSTSQSGTAQPKSEMDNVMDRLMNIDKEGKIF